MTGRPFRPAEGRGSGVRGRIKRITAHTDTELDAAVQQAVSHCAQRGVDFYRVLHGIDAYVERRRRREILVTEKMAAEERAAADKDDHYDNEDMWGGS